MVRSLIYNSNIKYIKLVVNGLNIAKTLIWSFKTGRFYYKELDLVRAYSATGHSGNSVFSYSNILHLKRTNNIKCMPCPATIDE